GPAVQNYHYDHLHQLVATDGLFQPEAKRRFRSSLALAYDEIGNLTSKDQRNVRETRIGDRWDADIVRDTTYTLGYVYGGPGPHAPTQVDEPTALLRDDRQVFFRYDADGNQVARFRDDRDHPFRSQTWDSEDHLKAVDGPGVRQDMLYDAAGN